MSLTRSQVAQRIGRSLATVRQLEDGGHLTAYRGPGGEHLFDDADVAELAESAARNGRVLPAKKWHADSSPAGAAYTNSLSARIVDLEKRERDLNDELERVRSCVGDAVDELLDIIGRRNRAALDTLERLLTQIANG